MDSNRVELVATEKGGERGGRRKKELNRVLTTLLPLSFTLLFIFFPFPLSSSSSSSFSLSLFAFPSFLPSSSPHSHLSAMDDETAQAWRARVEELEVKRK